MFYFGEFGLQFSKKIGYMAKKVCYLYNSTHIVQGDYNRLDTQPKRIKQEMHAEFLCSLFFISYNDLSTAEDMYTELEVDHER
jgi:hypothetical protein